jgi:mannitol/fructose-specific phosphotransferase system IIA component (Ntr-type)/predicted transcriptional regulator
MQLSDCLSPDTILLDFQAADKWSLLDTMVEVAMRTAHMAEQKKFTPESVRKAVIEREREKSTGVGRGCAFPHARLSGLDAPTACLAILHDPIEFGSLDGEPVRIVCLLLVPEESPQITLKIMAQVAQMLSERAARRFLLNTRNRDSLFDFLRNHGQGKEVSITARDIMRPLLFSVYTDTPLTEVTHLMERFSLESACILKHDETLAGQITCDLLFQFGMPEFFQQLRSISFIREFDPFEKYFQAEKNAVAGEVMSTSFSAVPESATLIEVVFELTVRNQPKVYVLREGRPVGVIDRITVLNRVINF